MKLVRNESRGKRIHKKLGLLMAIIGVLILVGWFVLQEVKGPWTITGWFAVMAAMIGFVEVFKTWINYYFGDRGEEALIKKLELLGDEYTVITNWQPPNEKRGDVDIIVLGPHGVAALECKRYTSDFGCDGDRWYVQLERGYKKKIKSLSSQTRGHAQCIKRHLKRQGVAAEVHPALVFNSLRRATILNPKTRIIDLDDAVDFIYSLPRTGKVESDHFGS